MLTALSDMVTSPLFVTLIAYQCLVVIALLQSRGRLRRAVFIGAIFAAVVSTTMAVINWYGLLSLLLIASNLFLGLVGAIGKAEKYPTNIAKLKLFRESISIVVMQTVLLFMLELQMQRFDINGAMATGITVISTVAAISLAVAVIVRQKNRLQMSKVASNPSVSLAIPARNETHALAASLDTSIDSTYQKLEVLVLDDCSHDNTPQIIKSFALEGVRFVQGQIPPDDWLGKTFAYHQLAEHASGQLIVFSDVDVQLNGQAIDSITAYMDHRSLNLLSILPERNANDILSNMVQSVLTFAQFASPHRFPSTGSLWAIRAESLSSFGGFEKVKSSLQPDRLIAHGLGKHESRFVLSRGGIAVSRKRVSSQIDSLIRRAYPSIGSSLSNIALIIMAQISLAYAALVMSHDLQVLAHASLLILWCAFSYVAFSTMPFVSAIVASLVAPIQLLVQTATLVISALRYEFSELGWKNRNVCVPVLAHKPPKLDP